MEDKVKFLEEQLKGETLLTDECREQVKKMRTALKEVLSKLHDCVAILEEYI